MWAAKRGCASFESNAFLLKMNARPAFERGTCNRKFQLTKYLLILETNSFLFGFMFVDF